MLPPERRQRTADTGKQPAPAGESSRPAALDATALNSGNGAADDASTLTLDAAEAAQDHVRSGRLRSRGALRAVGRAATTAVAACAASARTLVQVATRVRSAPAVASLPVKVWSADVAGTVLARLTVLPAVLILAWLVAGVPLLLAGGFLPVPMTVISVVLAVTLTVNGLRVVPASWPRLISSGRQRDPGWTAWFGLLATVVVVAGLTGWQLTESSSVLIVTRDQGTYLQTGYWIAQHGFLPISKTLGAFGAARTGLHFASTGFAVRGSGIYPAVLPGLPLLLAGGFWVHGITGALALGPVLGGMAALTFAGLVGRLIGPQWAPAGALILGLSLPQQYVGRTTLSETALQIMVFGGLCLLADSVALRGAGEAARAQLVVAWLLATPSRWAARLTPQRVLAAVAGLVLSFGLLVSLDALVYLLVVIPFAAALVIGRRPQATPFLSGLVFGLLYGALCLYMVDRPLLDATRQTVTLAGVMAVWLVALSVVASQFARMGRVRRAVPRALARWLPEAGAAVAIAVLIGFAVRPYVQQVRGHPSSAVYSLISSLQRLQGLPIDPTRTYAEQTLYWVIWYIGLPTVLLGAFGLVLLVRSCLRALLTWRDPSGVWRVWGLPLAMICAGSLVVLWTPDIVPDQPWASRRLIVMVIPGLIACGLWGASWLSRWARERGAKPVTAALAGLFCVAAMLVPTVSTTFGLGLSHHGTSGGLAPVAQGLALTRTGAGESAAVSQLCASIPPHSTVLILDSATASEFAQVIRGMCGVPAAWMVSSQTSVVQAMIGSISAAGRRPVLVAASPRPLLAFGGTPVRVLDLATTADPQDLTQLPTALRPVRYEVWIAPVPVG